MAVTARAVEYQKIARLRPFHIVVAILDYAALGIERALRQVGVEETDRMPPDIIGLNS